MSDVPKDPRAKLWSSELVTVGILFVLRGQSQRRFYRWLWGNFGPLFPHLPERTRLFRLLQRYHCCSVINVGRIGSSPSPV